MIIKREGAGLIRAAIPLLLTAVVIYGAIAAASGAERQAMEQARKMTYESIRRAAVQCYALEGVYPVSIDYLTERYGIRPDRNRFIIHYQFIGDNLLPDISVIPISGKAP